MQVKSDQIVVSVHHVHPDVVNGSPVYILKKPATDYLSALFVGVDVNC
jgi:hypothetical protein